MTRGVIFENCNGQFRFNWGRITLLRKFEQLLGDSNPSGLTLTIWDKLSPVSKFWPGSLPRDIAKIAKKNSH